MRYICTGRVYPERGNIGFGCKLGEAEVEPAKGATVKDACRKLGVTEHTSYRWRREYGGLKLDPTKRLKKHVAKKEFDLSILKEVSEGNI